MADARTLPFGPLHYLLQEATGRRDDFTRVVVEVYDVAIQQFRTVCDELPRDATATTYLANTIVGTARAWLEVHDADSRPAFEALWARYTEGAGGPANCALLLRAMRAEHLLLAEMADRK